MDAEMRKLMAEAAELGRLFNEAERIKGARMTQTHHEQVTGRRDPTPDEIRAGCALARESWSEAEHRRRAGLARSAHVEITETSLAESGGCDWLPMRETF